MDKNLCPGCEAPVPAKPRLHDAAERPWHPSCAERALANGFRTPLGAIDASAAVTFECCARDPWTAPHSFHLREIVLEEGVAVSSVFLGTTVMVYAFFEPNIFSDELPGRRIVIDHDFPLGLSLTVQGVPADLKYTLVGERRRESAPPRPSSNQCLGVAPLKSEFAVEPGSTVETSFFMVVAFRGERLCVEDWQNWEVVDVRVGGDPGRSVVRGVPLAGRSTDVPTYTSRVAETVTYVMRNKSAEARTFRGRIYGTLTWR